MKRASDLGHTVLFVDPPINTGRLFFKQLFAGKWPLSRILSGIYFDLASSLKRIVVYSPLDFLPDHKDLSKLHAKKINSLAKKYFDPTRKTILWIYHVEIKGLENYIQEVTHDFLVYDCVDNYAGFPRYNTEAKKDAINKQEQLLATKANLVFASAPGLVDKLKKYNQSVYYTPNVGDYERFKDAKLVKGPLPEDIASVPRPIIGFTGAVDEYKFDKNLFRKVAEDFPGYSFVIIGSIALKGEESSLKALGLADLKNVYFLGSKDFRLLSNYFAAFDAFIIPYQLNDYTVGGCFPIKFHDALAAGFPVVVTDLPAYKPFDEVCYISKGYGEFSQNIRRALEEDSPEKIQARQLVAKENSWEGKVAKLLDLINSHIGDVRNSGEQK
jgi:glycosyltransferase involved in cell wall biosynthesis